MTPAPSAALPQLDNALPIENAIAPLREALIHRTGAVVVAPPGAGKTTVIPLRLLDEPWLNGRRIIVLEPRRLAARAAAERMAHLIGEKVGDTVGFQTRDERRISNRTRIEVLTEGILTRRLQNDPSLSDVAVVLFDEVHERNVMTDMGLAFLLNARATLETDVRIVAMSATPQVEKFAKLLADAHGDAPLVESEGRTFPVDVRYVPRQRNDRLENAVSDAVLTSLRNDEGDVLVFLPGIGEINRVRDTLAPHLPPNVDIVRLAGALPFAEQDAALAPSAHGRRRVVLSTDIAETSLTVDGVHIVVDAGLARAPRLDQRTGLTELVTVTSSRASADQRSGRAGRVAPGVAYRLWSKIEDATRLAHLPAEITQVDLCGVALDVAAWGTPVAELAFLDQPPSRAMSLAIDTLHALHLLTDDNTVTDAGRRAMALPLHPRLANMVVRSAPSDAWLACVVAASLDDRDVLRGRPSDLPTDIATRILAILDIERHPDADRNGVRRVLERARDIPRRAGVAAHDSLTAHDVHSRTGAVLLLAYPDRLAKRRATPGQFIMRTGGGAWMDAKDSLAKEEFIAIADLDADRKSSRIRRAGGLGPDEVVAALGDDVTVKERTEWNRERAGAVQVITRSVGSIALDERTIPAPPSEDTTKVVLAHVKATKLEALNFDDDTHQFVNRVQFLRHNLGDEWPDVSRSVLLSTLDEWLAPFLAGSTTADDLARIDVTMILSSQLSWDQSNTLNSLAPPRFEPPRGRPVPIDYSDPSAPAVSVRVQHVFGVTQHPTVLGNAVPLKMQLLSPADRPIQVTSDLPGFWRGSWSEVRKEMAGRYPKHNWPVDPLRP